MYHIQNIIIVLKISFCTINRNMQFKKFVKMYELYDLQTNTSMLMHYAARHLDSEKKISSLKLYNDNVIFIRTKKTH